MNRYATAYPIFIFILKKTNIHSIQYMYVYNIISTLQNLLHDLISHISFFFCLPLGHYDNIEICKVDNNFL
jgi:hypothetical protein